MRCMTSRAAACGLLLALTALIAAPVRAQYVQQGPKLVGTGGVSPNPRQGAGVAVSADGSTLAVGGPLDGGTIGTVWVYVRVGNAWVQQGAPLVGSGNTGGLVFQGTSVALSADGNTLLVGAPWDNSGIGAGWVFTRSAGVWTQQGAKLVGTGATPSTRQGTSVALSADGNTALLGGLGDSGGAGAMWAFQRTAGVWSQVGAKLTGSGAVGLAGQGYAIAISGDGNTALLGGKSDNGGIGATWVFVKSAGVWSQQGGKLVGTGAVGASNQGWSVALSADGNTAVAGGYNDDGGAGALWTFTRSGTSWSQQGAKLTASDENGPANLGGHVTVSSDGGTLAAGGPADDGGVGAAWTFRRNGPTWSQLGGKRVGAGAVGAAGMGSVVALSGDAKLLVVGGPNDDANAGAAWVFVDALTPFPGNAQFVQQAGKHVGAGASGAAAQGNAVAMSKDGGTAAVGGVHDAADRGAVWVYARSGATWAAQGAKLVGTGGSAASFQGASLALSRDGGTLAVGSGAGDGAWIYSRSGGVWSQQARVTGTGAVGSAAQGSAVALSDDGNTLLLCGQSDDGFKGAVWVFTRAGSTWTQQGAKLVANDGAGASFMGMSAALSPDGNLSLVGGAGDDNSRGAAWVFARVGNTWSQQGAKLPGVFSSSLAGISVALSEDGRTALVGSAFDAARVFVRNGSGWSAQGPGLSGTGASALQSNAVALSADGDLAMVGEGSVGAVWAFTRSHGVWHQLGPEAYASDAVGGGTSGMGASVALSADGETAVFGGGGDAASTGAAWFFANPLVTDCQYASQVLDYSSQYNTGNDNWHAVRALGAPTVYPNHADDSQAWASANPDDQPEYLDLGFAHGARINFVNVFETFSPGAVDTIAVRNPYSGEFETVWTGVAAAAPPRARIFTAMFAPTRFPVSEVRVHVNSPAVPDWNEIDAVDIGYRDLTAGTQFASGVVAKSSEFSALDWGAVQATGAPNLYPLYADDPRAWASATPDDQQEFLTLSYATPQTISYVNVYETFAPGALKQVSVKNPGTGDFEVVWSGAAEVAPPVARIRTVSFPETRFSVSEVKLEFDTPAVPDWNEVDAVGIGHCSCLAVPLDAPGPAALTHDVLELARPNPFAASTAVAFTLSRPGRVKVEVFSVQGQRVATVTDGPMTLGRHEARWNGRDAHGRAVASGVYYVRVATPGLTATRKVVKVD
ncbi:MAG: FlgD immunoglobulin-like domain containing protein [Candidatus Eisenbacteria bacterium]